MKKTLKKIISIAILIAIIFSIPVLGNDTRKEDIFDKNVFNNLEINAGLAETIKSEFNNNDKLKNISIYDIENDLYKLSTYKNHMGILLNSAFKNEFLKSNIYSENFAGSFLDKELNLNICLTNDKFKEKYDVAIALYDVIGSFPNDKENLNLLKSIRKILNNKGILIISVMNMTYTKRKCWNVLEDIDDNIDALLKLQGTNTMQKTGDVFSGDSMLIDDKSGIVYRKEQFFSKNSLPCEYIIRDRRYTIKGIDNLLQKAGFRVIDSYCFSAKNMSQEVDEISGKEIFVVAQKQNSLSLPMRD